MKKFLITKLLAIHLVVIGFVIVVVWIAVDTLAAGYFVTLMEKYNVSPKPAHAMFVSAIHRYLIWASLAAAVLAVVLSFLMLRRVLSPLTRMTGITRDIARGEFNVRVPAGSGDEIGQLAEAFNHMAGSLEEIENLRKTLMIDVAHELRTPLTNIRGYLEALNDGVVPPETETFILLQEETLRLVNLVEDVLQLARADAARGSLNIEPVDIKQVLTDTLESFAPAFERKFIKIKTSIPRNRVTVPGDPGRIHRVFRNLTDNIVRYTPENGEAEIQIERTPDFVNIIYLNAVQELLPQDLPYIFERFYRGEKSRSRQHGGAGIGLAIVKELVEAHGGTVGAEYEQDRIKILVQLPVPSPPPERDS